MNGQLHALATLLQGKASVVLNEDESWRTTNTSVNGASLKCKSFANKRYFYPQTKIRSITYLTHLAEKLLEVGRLYLGE
jgi:hypothetical protein